MATSNPPHKPIQSTFPWILHHENNVIIPFNAIISEIKEYTVIARISGSGVMDR